LPCGFAQWCTCSRVHPGVANSARRTDAGRLAGCFSKVWKLLSPKTVNRIFEVQSNSVDLVLGVPLKIGVGYGLSWPEVLPFAPEGRQCFRTGAGGSLVIADADRRMTVAYVMNKMAPCLIVGPIAAALVECVYEIMRK
jgi:hypothetical protein